MVAALCILCFLLGLASRFVFVKASAVIEAKRQPINVLGDLVLPMPDDPRWWSCNGKPRQTIGVFEVSRDYSYGFESYSLFVQGERVWAPHRKLERYCKAVFQFLEAERHKELVAIAAKSLEEAS